MDEHAELLPVARRSIELVRTLGERLRHGSTHYYQHTEMADRARALAHHLDAGLALAGRNAYPSSFAVLRVCLEHQLLDDLIFRGRRLVQLIDGVTAEQFAKWKQERESGADWTRDILDWRISRKGTVRT